MGFIVMDFISSMGHPRSDSSDGLLMMDNSVHIQGTDVILYITCDNANPAGKGLISRVDYM
jgi:hypothetical protein